jgi:hypothetical protein
LGLLLNSAQHLSALVTHSVWGFLRSVMFGPWHIA